MTDRMNTPASDRAAGITAPLIRAAGHVAYVLGYIEDIEDDAWAGRLDALFGEMQAELQEGINHMRNSDVDGDNPYVEQEVTDLLRSLRVQLDAIRVTRPENRADLIRELQNVGHNIAYVGARLDRSTAGILAAHEGLLA